MKKEFQLNQKVTVFDQEGTITEVIDITNKPHLYAVTFDNTGKQYVIEAEHIEAAIDTRPITERVKTFEDAVAVLGEDNILVEQYRAAIEKGLVDVFAESEDVIAFLKLRIITAALNDGWHPTFAEDEYRYYPWFYIYTEDEYNNLDEDEKAQCCRVVGRSSGSASAGGGLADASASNASSSSSSNDGSRLAFKTRDLALYAGKQFISIWCDFLLQ